MSLEKNIERIADALEKLAGGGGCSSTVEGTIIPAVVKDADRDSIKKELDALGVQYNQNCITKTLKKLLEDSKVKPAETVVATQAAPVVAPVAAQTEAAVTVDQAIAFLSQVCAAQGEEVAFAMLQKYGAAKVSDLTEAQRTEIVKTPAPVAGMLG